MHTAALFWVARKLDTIQMSNHKMEKFWHTMEYNGENGVCGYIPYEWIPETSLNEKSKSQKSTYSIISYVENKIYVEIIFLGI